MSQTSRQQWLNARIEEAVARRHRTQTENEKRRGHPPRPGDVFAFAETAEYPVRWAVIEQDLEHTERLLVVALDANPLVGSTDVAIPAGSPTGASTLRCAFEAWLDAGDFDPELRSGFLEPEVLEQARRKRAEIEGGNVTASSQQRDMDSEPEYLDWAEKVIAKAQAVLSVRVRKSYGPSTWSDLAPPDADWTVSDGKPLELVIEVDAGDDAGGEELDQLTRLLLSELRDLDLERAELLRGQEVPAGARSAEAVVVGSISVEVTPGILPRVIAFLHEWLTRGKRRGIKIVGEQTVELEYSAESPSRDELITLVKKLIGDVIKKKEVD